MADPISFASSTPRHSLPLLFQGQAQKEFFVNEALSLLDALVNPTVEGVADAPPISSVEGESWIVSTNPAGEWAGHADKLAIFIAGSWKFAVPQDGLQVFDSSVFQMRVFSGSWNAANTPVIPQGGTTIDAEARQAITDIVTALRQAGILPPTAP